MKLVKRIVVAVLLVALALPAVLTLGGCGDDHGRRHHTTPLNPAH